LIQNRSHYFISNYNKTFKTAAEVIFIENTLVQQMALMFISRISGYDIASRLGLQVKKLVITDEENQTTTSSFVNTER
jgi:hypothetical protein